MWPYLPVRRRVQRSSFCGPATGAKPALRTAGAVPVPVRACAAFGAMYELRSHVIIGLFLAYSLLFLKKKPTFARRQRRVKDANRMGLLGPGATSTFTQCALETAVRIRQLGAAPVDAMKKSSFHLRGSLNVGNGYYGCPPAQFHEDKTRSALCQVLCIKKANYLSHPSAKLTPGAHCRRCVTKNLRDPSTAMYFAAVLTRPGPPLAQTSGTPHAAHR